MRVSEILKNFCQLEAEKYYNLNDTTLLKQRNEVLDQRGQSFNSSLVLFMKLGRNKVKSLRQNVVLLHRKCHCLP